MLNIGDYAIHKTTGDCGQVVAYGHEIVDSAYLPTLKVELVSNTEMSKRTFVEDLTSNWMPAQKEENSEYKISPAVESVSSKELTRV